MKFIVHLALLLVLLTSCSGIKILSEQDIYPPEFLKKIDGIQTIYRDGDKQTAINKLLGMNDQELTTDEKSKKYNLLGVFVFSRQDHEQALNYFNEARRFVSKDKALQAQIYLNIASTYYKQNQFQKSYQELQNVEVEALSIAENEKYYLLKYILASKFEEPKQVVEALVNLLKKSSSFDEIKQTKYKEALIDNYRKMADTERVYLLENNYDSKNLVIAFLAQSEVWQRYLSGDKSGAKDVITWLDTKYGDTEEVKDFIKDFNYRMENFSKVDVNAVGVVLPLSGENEKYGERALMGIETAISEATNKKFNLKIHTRNNHNNSFVAKQMIQDLVQSQHVSIIIGGLFPDTAREEYLEARKYGVLFISLSPVYVDKELKTHLLIEVPGSVQSQLETIFSDKLLQSFGEKVGLFYPNEQRGKIYLNEIWNNYRGKTVRVNSIQSFEKNIDDYREPVQQILGLKFKRERQEELEVVKEIHKLEKQTRRTTIRQIQDLEPIADFEWVFIPSYPHEAVKILPSFRYFDAANVTFIGGPSWLSKKLVYEQKNLGKPIYFVGDDPNDFKRDFIDFYKKRNSRTPRLMEILAYEAMNLSFRILTGGKIDKRDQLESRLITLKEIEGVTGRWHLKDGIWLKDMDFLKISRGKIEKVNLTANKQVEQ